MDTVEYAPGRNADVYGAPSDPPLLLWHGTQTDSRAAVRVLADELERRGFGVVAADWNSHAPDGGRSDLLASVDHIRGWTEYPHRLTLVGWSLGGAAAAGLTLRAAQHGAVLVRTVCLAGAFMVPDPLSGTRPAELLDEAGRSAPMLLLHGRADDVVPPSASHEFASALRSAGRPVDVTELDADHGNIAGARYDAGADRYEPADDPGTREVAAAVADLIAAGR
jgi:dienelactone hydrolase